MELKETSPNPETPKITLELRVNSLPAEYRLALDGKKEWWALNRTLESDLEKRKSIQSKLFQETNGEFYFAYRGDRYDIKRQDGRDTRDVTQEERNSDLKKIASALSKVMSEVIGGEYTIDITDENWKRIES